MGAALVGVLKYQDYGDWSRQHAQGLVAGGPLGPYSVNLLGGSGLEVRCSDDALRARWQNPLVRKVVGVTERRSPALRGWANTVANLGLLRHADVNLAIFEDQGGFAAALRTTALRRLLPKPYAIVTCWIGEDAQHASRSKLATYRRLLAGADLVFYFSTNQTPIFTDLLQVEPAKLRPIRFGIDAAFFAGDADATAETDAAGEVDGAGEPHVLAVGNDQNRDHQPLLDAARGAQFAVRIYAPVALPDVPPNVTWITDRIDHLGYRRALAAATAVVVPTRPVAYPCGQTVVLEAMAAGRAVIATDTPAMREYVSHGEDGLLVPPGDADALRAAIALLLADAPMRRSMAAAGRAKVLAGLDQRHMWDEIGGHLQALL